MDKTLAALTTDEKDKLIKRLCEVLCDLTGGPSPDAVLSVAMKTTLGQKDIRVVLVSSEAQVMAGMDAYLKTNDIEAARAAIEKVREQEETAAQAAANEVINKAKGA